MLADLIDVHPEYERAVEAALGGFLDKVMAEVKAARSASRDLSLE